MEDRFLIYNGFMSKAFVICFAGVPGCGKSSVAHQIAMTHGLPRFERDKIRNEVKMDFGVTDINEPRALEEFNRLSESRQRELVSAGVPYVLDSSVDRTWEWTKKLHEENGYKLLVISFDLSAEWVKNHYEKFTNEHEPFREKYFKQHVEFVEKYGSDVSLTIEDKSLPDRIALSEQAVRDFLLTI